MNRERAEQVRVNKRTGPTEKDAVRAPANKCARTRRPAKENALANAGVVRDNALTGQVGTETDLSGNPTDLLIAQARANLKVAAAQNPRQRGACFVTTAITRKVSVACALRSSHNRQPAQNELASVGAFFRPAIGRTCAPLLWTGGVSFFDN